MRSEYEIQKGHDGKTFQQGDASGLRLSSIW